MENTLTTTTDSLDNNDDNMTKLEISPIFFIVFIVIILFILIYSLGNTSTDSDPNDWTFLLNMIYGTLILCFIVFLVIQLIEYIFNINISTRFLNMFSNHPEIDVIIDEKQNTSETTTDNTTPSVEPTQPTTPPDTGKITRQQQVFNIPGNNYSYHEASALCKAYDARLAKYEEIEDAYTSGAEWCNYGWSDQQMALFPTQKLTFDTLQKIPGHKNDCGRPGINGGYIKNKNVKFGVNCYGYKPKITPEENNLMSTTTPYPLNKADISFQENIDYWKGRINEIIVSPFNYTSWSRV
jgi:hypothetical protein